MLSKLLSLFLAITLIFSLSGNPSFGLQETLAPQSILSDLSDPASLNDEYSVSELIGILLRSAIRREAQVTVIRELLIVGLAFILPLFVLGCMLAPTKENISNLTQKIRDKIQAGEDGNSYEIVDLIDERRDLIEESEIRRPDLIGGNGLDLKGLAKDIYLEFGVIVEGARERDLLHIQDLLRILPPQHVEEFHSFVLSVKYDRFYDHNAGGRYYQFQEGVVSFSPRLLAVGKGSVTTGPLAHEVGHFVHIEKEGTLDALIFWWHHLVCSWGEDAYPTKYAQKNNWEEYAEIYEGWVKDTTSFISDTRKSLFSPNPKSKILLEKVLMVARKFLFQKDDYYYIRVYENMNYHDFLIDIKDPDELEVFHLYKLRHFVYRSREVNENKNYLDVYYHDPRGFVDFVLSTDGYEEELVARRIYRMLEKINEDQELNDEEKRKRAIHLIYSFLNADPSKSASALQRFQNLRKSQGDNFIEFRPEELETLDELEAMWFIEPESVEDWLFNNTHEAMEKIRTIIPYFENLDSPHSWPVLFLAIYDGLMTHENPTPQMLLQILTNYYENQVRISNKFSQIVKLEASLLFRFLAEWNPDFLREYLGSEIEEEIKKEIREGSFELSDEGLSPEEFVNRSIALSIKKKAPIEILLEGKYASVEVAKLFSEDISRTIELLLGSARPLSKEDLQSLVSYNSNWIGSWRDKDFKPVLEELRNRFQGIPIKEMIEIVGTRKNGEKLITKNELLGIFVFLNSDLENFIQNSGRWFLDFAQRVSPDDSWLKDSKKAVDLNMQLDVLFEVSPEAFDLLFNQLTEEEVAIVFDILFGGYSTSWKARLFTEKEVFDDDSFIEVRILESILQNKGEEWIKEQILRERENIWIESKYFNHLLVYLQGEISNELRDLLASFLLESQDIKKILFMTGESELRNRIFRMSQILPEQVLMGRLTKVLEEIKDKGRQEILNTIIEEIKSGHFKREAPSIESSSQSREKNEDEIFEEWKKLRERWEEEKEEEKEERKKKEEEKEEKTSSLIDETSHLAIHAAPRWSQLPLFQPLIFENSL